MPLAKHTLYKVLSLDVLAIAATFILSAPFQKVSQQFDDGGFITYFSVIQLFILSYFMHQVFKLRAQSFKRPWKSPALVWAVFSLGFSFLALDDWLMIHELVDKTIHKVWLIQETAVSDRIDDLIVGLYGLIAIGIFVRYRYELKKYKVVMPYVITGFVCLFLMVGIDTVTHRNDILLTVFSAELTGKIMSWAFVLEESFKIISEGLLIVAAHTCLKIARRIYARKQASAADAMLSKETIPNPACSHR